MEGYCQEFATVDVSDFADWIAAIPFEEWPQQRRLTDGVIRPAMVTDLDWHGFREAAMPATLEACAALGDVTKLSQFMLSVVMPGHSIPKHRDEQPDYWKFRVHIPLLTNKLAVAIMDDGEHQMLVGRAYKFNTRANHAIENRGDTPRIHFMFDVQ